MTIGDYFGPKDYGARTSAHPDTEPLAVPGVAAELSDVGVAQPETAITVRWV